MKCPECGKVLPDNAANCKKCGTVFKENKGSAEMEAFLKKEKAAVKDAKLNKHNGKKPVNKGLIIGIVAAAVIIGVALGLLFHFDIIGNRNSHRVEEKGPLDIEYTFEIDEEDEVVMKLGDVEITAAEYEFFYLQSYSTLQNSSQLSFKEYVSKKEGSAFDESEDYYEEYYQSFAEENPNTFDFSKPVNMQPNAAKDSKTGNEIPWEKYIREDAIKTMVNHRVKYELAVEMGLELTDDVRLQVYEHIEGLRDAVLQGGYPALEDYLKILFGEACDEEFFKNELIREYMATKYQTEINAKLMAEMSDEEIKSVYEADYKEYDFADIYVYEVKGDNAQEIAQKIAADSKNLNEFTKAISTHVSETASKESYPAVPKYYIDGNYSAEMGEWAFDRERNQNDVSVFKTQKGYSVAFVYAPVYTKKDCVSYREIMLKKTDANGNPLADEELDAVEKKINDLFKQWKKSDKTQDDFAYLAITESQADTASSGGIKSGAVGMEMNEDSLKQWLLSKDRKPGDVEIVETDDAYRIAYFIQSYGDYWNYSIKSAKASEAAAEEIEKAENENYAVKYEEEALVDFEDEYIERISEIYLGL